MMKKGQSQIITTVLLILIVLAAVIIVWQVIKNFVEPGVNEQDDCFRVQLSFEGVTCDASGNVDGSIKRGPDNLGSIQMKFILGDGTTDLTAETAPGALGTKAFTTITGASTGDMLVVSALVGPNLDTLCAPSDQIKLDCS